MVPAGSSTLGLAWWLWVARRGPPQRLCCGLLPFVLTVLRTFPSLQAATDWEEAAESGRVEPAEVRCGTAEGWHGKLDAPC